MAHDPVTFTLSHLMPSDGVLSEPVLITAGIQDAASMVRAILLLMLLPASLSLSLYSWFSQGTPCWENDGAAEMCKNSSISLSLSLAQAPSSSLSLNGGGQTRPAATDLQSPTFKTQNQSFGCSLQHVRRCYLI